MSETPRSHPLDDEFHAYLDGGLSQKERQALEAHTAVCSECAAQLDGLRGLFAAIESIHDVPLRRDLRRPVLARIRASHRGSKRLGWILAGQGVLVGVLVVATRTQIAPALAGLLAVPIESRLATGAAILGTALERAAQQGFLAARAFVHTIPPHLPSLEATWIQGATLLGAAGVLWIVGNSLLLARRWTRRPKSHAARSH